VRAKALFAGTIAGITAITACSAFVSLDGLRDDDAGNDGAPDAIASDADSGPLPDGPAPDTGACPSLEGPALVRVDNYCVDSTEVTRAQYLKFLNAMVDPSKQDSTCAWNGSFVPSTWDPDAGDLPVTYLDWCDARAYCQWAGKHLCGAVGGGAIAFNDFVNGTTSQWYRACSAAGSKPYPYGATYDPYACNGIDSEAGTLEPVGTRKTCVGGYPGLFDMVGNAGEWIDSCDQSSDGGGPQLDQCRTTGGTCVWNNPGNQWTRCDNVIDTNARQDVYGDRGFRCCL
jgi:formylglycine-generating enzyme required for sulfatase activity